jgi:hypothetical protein
LGQRARCPPGRAERHTIGYHLHKVYAKLNITSRTELSQLDLDDDGPR